MVTNDEQSHNSYQVLYTMGDHRLGGHGCSAMDGNNYLRYGL